MGAQLAQVVRGEDDLAAGFERDAIGAVVLDMRMPALSGIALLERLVAEGVDQPLIMLTGHGTVELCRRAFKAGAAEFLEKPVNDDLLIDTLQQAVRTIFGPTNQAVGTPSWMSGSWYRWASIMAFFSFFSLSISAKRSRVGSISAS